jgi:L-fucose isomerase-like protein
MGGPAKSPQRLKPGGGASIFGTTEVVPSRCQRLLGNRGFFPDHLAKSGREEMMQVLHKAGMDVVVPGPEHSKHGAGKRPGQMLITHRRDSFCGKMSACNNSRQYGIPYSITTLHTESLGSAEFAKAWIGSPECAES